MARGNKKILTAQIAMAMTMAGLQMSTSYAAEPVKTTPSVQVEEEAAAQNVNEEEAAAQNESEGEPAAQDESAEGSTGESTEGSTEGSTETPAPEVVSNGWPEKEDGMHYYVDGAAITGKGYFIDGSWYYFDENGVSKRNWLRKKGTDVFGYDAEGRLVQNAEFDIDGKHYKFLGSGAAYKGWDETAEGKCYYTEDGSRATDLGTKLDGYWYYFDETGHMLKGWRSKADGSHYYYDESGHLLTNRGMKIDGNWYYLTSTGRRLQNEFRLKENDSYYYDGEGRLAINSEADVNGKHYKFTGSGAAYKGWDGEAGCYYLPDGSRAANQGIKVNGYWCYFDEDGQMLKGRREKTDGWYYYDSEGHLVMNCGLKVDGEWYYMTGSGRILQGEFRRKGNDVYYYDEAGRMLKNTDVSIGGRRYCFQASGAAYQGLKEENGNVIGFDQDGRQVMNAGMKANGAWYYFDENGNMKRSCWREKGGAWYYYQADGKMAANQGLKLDGNWYYFQNSGMMHKGWRNKGGDKFYYDEAGRMVKGCTMTIDGAQYQFGSDGKAVATQQCIGLFSTVSTNNANGTFNMKKALGSFNQVVIQPGQTLSFFGVAGPCGAAEGYLPGGVVGGVGYGGGICQASTTLYGAAVRAGLTIVQRNNHSVPSTYVPIGQDAMVNYGTSDLKIRNDYETPVTLVTYSNGNTLYAEVWGMKPDWYDYIDVVSWKTGAKTAVAHRRYIKNGQVVHSQELPSSRYR